MNGSDVVMGIYIDVGKTRKVTFLICQVSHCPEWIKTSDLSKTHYGFCLGRVVLFFLICRAYILKILRSKVDVFAGFTA